MQWSESLTDEEIVTCIIEQNQCDTFLGPNQFAKLERQYTEHFSFGIPNKKLKRGETTHETHGCFFR